jgi:hypothetical protein
MKNFQYIVDTNYSPYANAIRKVTSIPTYSLIRQPKNIAFHNLCLNSTKLPPLKQLLGLGLNFCPAPTTGTTFSQTGIDKFVRDYRTKIFFADQPDIDRNGDEKLLYLPSTDWTPPEPINPELVSRENGFISSIENLFSPASKPKAQPTTLLPNQTFALQWLQSNEEIVVFSSDKNLGPCVIERDRYVEFAYKFHLSDTNTYQRLTPADTRLLQSELIRKIESFTSIFARSLSKMDILFLTRSLNNVTGTGLSYLYQLAKIHKQPMKTRAIISYSGSYPEGIARWLDKELKKITKHMKYIAKSSRQVAQELTSRTWPPGIKLFTLDAVSMYTNIHLGHALPVILNFLQNTEYGKQVHTKSKVHLAPLEYALDLVMSYNLFAFGDTFWRQTSGTAMGGPPAPEYATLYFAIRELEIIPLFPEILYYTRYIDDGLSIWQDSQDSQESSPSERLLQFKNCMNTFGSDHSFFTENPEHKPLQWTFEDPSIEAVFLDLRVTTQEGNIKTQLYEKELNLYLYIPATSCHPPSILKSIIFGAVHRAKVLNSSAENIMPCIVKTFQRLLARGYSSDTLKPLFQEATNKILRANLIDDTQTEDTNATTTDITAINDLLYFQLKFNPLDPQRNSLHHAFNETIVSPPRKRHLSQETNAPFKRLQICYKKQQSLGNILSPRKGRFTNYSVASELEKLSKNSDFGD